MKIYTRTGDKGETGLFGGTRVSKSALRMHAYGTIDELNAVLGVAMTEKMTDTVAKQLSEIQGLLFAIGADLATPLESRANVKRIDAAEATKLEQWIDQLEESLPPLTSFIYPSGSAAGCQLHLARTVCRRAERWIVELGDQESINKEVLVCVNRLSDYLFVAARYINKENGSPERIVEIERAS